jgi:hypothetical protein
LIVFLRPNTTAKALIILYQHFVLVYFDDAGALVSEHLAEDLVDDTFVDKSRKIVYLSDLERVDAVAVFVYQLDADIV